MIIKMVREYNLSFGRTYDLLEVEEKYKAGDKVVMRELRRYRVRRNGPSMHRLIKVIEGLPIKHKYISVGNFGWFAIVAISRRELRRLSVSPQLNGSSSTATNDSTKGG